MLQHGKNSRHIGGMRRLFLFWQNALSYWQNALSFWQKALLLVPENGNCYNTDIE